MGSMEQAQSHENNYKEIDKEKGSYAVRDRARNQDSSGQKIDDSSALGRCMMCGQNPATDRRVISAINTRKEGL